MENTLTAFVAPIIGLCIGVIVTWLVLRSKADDAVEFGRASAQVELATGKERLRATEEELQYLHAEHKNLNLRANKLREEVTLTTNENAQLAERASRIPSLEASLVLLGERDKSLQREIMSLSSSEAEKIQLLESTKKRLAEIDVELAEARSHLDNTSRSYNEISEKYAASEVKIARIVPLEQSVAAKDEQLLSIGREVGVLKEEGGRLLAQLKAEEDKTSATEIQHSKLQAKIVDLDRELSVSREQTSLQGTAIGRLDAELTAEKTAHKLISEELDIQKTLNESASATIQKLTTELAELTVRFEAERELNHEKLVLLTEAREKLSHEFKNLAHEILEEKSKRFTEHNQTSMGQLINPLKERMAEFKSKVEEIHAKDIEQQAMLRSELTQLKDLNRQITEEAHGLATALKGQAKTQGNWGELILGNVLDRAGLCEGKDYRREVSFNTDEGRKRPDVVVSLPQNKHLVIDAKVSLNAYTRYVNADDESARAMALKEHVHAVSSRIQELSDRTYFDLPGLNTPEMVFMFIPIESAFVEALRADEELFQRAIANNILVATPTTLLTSLNIVRQLWRFEEQNTHTAELADRAAKVYKKLVSFLGSMEALGSQLGKAQDSYSKAMGQLVKGKGNLIQQANDFERLGVAIQTAIPEHLLAKGLLELEIAAPLDDDTAVASLQ